MHSPPYCTRYEKPDPVEWLRVWNALSRMKGLKTLHVRLYLTYDGEFMDWEGHEHEGWDRAWWHLSESDLAYTLAPIREVTTPEDFVMDFGFDCEAYKPAWDTLPCRVVRFK